MDELSSIATALLVLALCLVSYNAGHLLAAQLLGCRVVTCTIGVGPLLSTFTLRHTSFELRAIPLGGSVNFAGDNEEYRWRQRASYVAFADQPVWKRAVIVSAGPLATVLLGFACFALTFAAYGVPVDAAPASIAEVLDGSPAAAAGLRADDIVTAVGSTETPTWAAASDAMRRAEGESVDLAFERAGSSFHAQVTRPRPIDGASRWKPLRVLGIQRANPMRQVGVSAAIHAALAATGESIAVTYGAVGNALRGGDAEVLGTSYADFSDRTSVALDFMLSFVALISINLGVLNLLPIPTLNGGHLLYLGFEVVRGRPPSRRARERAEQIGMFLLLALMVFVLYNDISRQVRDR
jgi:regulator of sigma E protease